MLLGSAFEYYTGNGLKAKPFFNPPGQRKPKTVFNQFGGSFGSPVNIPHLYHGRNKTFFFFLWDQQLERDRTQMRPVVLTDCARNGVFRY